MLQDSWGGPEATEAIRYCQCHVLESGHRELKIAHGMQQMKCPSPCVTVLSSLQTMKVLAITLA